MLVLIVLIKSICNKPLVLAILLQTIKKLIESLCLTSCVSSKIDYFVTWRFMKAHMCALLPSKDVFFSSLAHVTSAGFCHATALCQILRYCDILRDVI